MRAVIVPDRDVYLTDVRDSCSKKEVFGLRIAAPACVFCKRGPGRGVNEFRRHTVH